MFNEKLELVWREYINNGKAFGKGIPLNEVKSLY
jgi:hypothetical protein